MNIWVDADACPAVIREILCRAAVRTAVVTTFVSNHAIPLPKSPAVKSLRVTSGFDIADNEIVKRVSKDDLVVTNDIPLASEIIDKGALALNVRGELYTSENIKARLNMRDFMETLRSSGIDAGGAPAMTQADRQAFANHLDRLLAQKMR